MQILKRLFAPLKNNKWPWFGYIITFAIRSINSFTFGYIAKSILDAISTNNTDMLIRRIIISAISVTIGHSASYITGRFWQELRPRVTQKLFETYLEKYLISDNNAIENTGSGKFNSIIQEGVKSQKTMVVDMMGIGTDMIITFTLWFIVIFFQSWIFGCILLVICAIVFAIARNQEKIINPLKKENKEHNTNVDKQILRTIQTKFEIIQSRKIEHEISTISKLQNKIKQVWHRIFNSRQTYIRLPSILINICEFATYYWLGSSIINGTHTVGDFVFFTMLATKFKDYLRQIGELNQQVAEHIVHIEKMRNTFDAIPEIENYDKWPDINMINWSIELQNISYYYHEAKEIFKDFSLSIAGWTKVAFVGSSGSGKTTLVKLISWYLKPTGWEILVDNQNLQSINLKSYYQHMGYLTQEPSVFDGTVLENLLYGVTSYELQATRPNSENKAWDLMLGAWSLDSIISLAQCQFIYDLPNGLDTQIGEKGVKLSGGQRQRLAIAKLMLKNPKVIILDEPTSALDSFSEEEVTKALNNLFQGKTVIIIAHRLQTVKRADRILVFENGAIIEDGNHTSLVAQWWIYAKMLELQSGF